MVRSGHEQETASPLCCREIQGCLETVEECVAMVAALGPEGFCATPAGPDSSLGAHLRHALEHYQCFFRGLPLGEIDYDTRDRNRALEESPELALEVLRTIQGNLAELANSARDRKLALRVLPSRQGEPVRVETTLRRELVFLANHTIHHLALMRVLALMAGCPPAQEVGVAFSTARHRQADMQHDGA